LLKQNLYFVSGTSTAFEIFEIFEEIEEIALVVLETEYVLLVIDHFTRHTPTMNMQIK
jgi:hypothetical protein